MIVLRHHRRQQVTERLALGPAWPDTGLVFTAENGAALHPAFVTDHFHDLADEIGLPPIRLHDLRVLTTEVGYGPTRDRMILDG